MDSSSFDQLARLAAGLSRRDALRSTLLAALAALGMTSFPGADEAAGKKRRKRKKRKKQKTNDCKPSCGANSCGDDGCGGSCGTCKSNEACQHGTCVCDPDCDEKTCGDDGCGGSCGACETNETCEDGNCVCVPDCDGSTCGDDGCGGTCLCDDQSFCQDETCVPCDPPCPPGERCIHGTCTCDPSNNQCPFEGPGQTNRCACGGQTVDGVGATCADRTSACPQHTPCTTHDDCPVGSVCKTTCVDPDDPRGPNRCSDPCVPV